MTEFVVLIPARLDSSRLPGKALADIHGKPMVVRVAEQAAKSKAARVVVATDHPDIQAACQAHGVQRPSFHFLSGIFVRIAPVPGRASKRRAKGSTFII